jgi:hypothetical protein
VLPESIFFLSIINMKPFFKIRIKPLFVYREKQSMELELWSDRQKSWRKEFYRIAYKGVSERV